VPFVLFVADPEMFFVLIDKDYVNPTAWKVDF
jgi:hypothetical protein